MESKQKLKKEKLIPPDLERCQALKPSRNSFMSFGGPISHVRCTNKPGYIITEKNPPKGSESCGSMSVCEDCLHMAIGQMGGQFTIKIIKSGPMKKAKGKK